MVDPEETQRLPVRRFAQDIARAVREHNVIVVLAETGSGKTTQIPQVSHCSSIQSPLPPFAAEAVTLLMRGVNPHALCRFYWRTALPRRAA